jgi:hypothetical protein
MVSGNVAPTTLNVRNLSTGTAVPVVTSAYAATFGADYSFTTDGKYLLYSTDLTTVTMASGQGGSVGTLYSFPLAGTSASAALGIVPTSSAKVWSAAPLTGSKIVYNQNFKVLTGNYGILSFLPNGAASADLYIADASQASPGTLLVTGADASDYFYTTKDKSKLFYSFSRIALGDANSTVAAAGDGIYVVAVP